MLSKSSAFFSKSKSCLFLSTGRNVVAFHRTLQTLIIGTNLKVNTFRTSVFIPFPRVNNRISVSPESDALEKTNPFNLSAKFYSSQITPNKTLQEILVENTKNERILKRQMVDETNDYMEDLSTKANISTEEWSKLKEMLLETPQFNATEKNVETVTMKLMNRYNIFRFARLYFNHLKSLSVDINPATLAIYVRYIFTFRDQCTAEDFLVAEEICSKLVESSPILSLTAADNVICGFSVTKNWRKSLEIFNEMKNLELSKRCYFAVAEACFRNKEFETGWEIVESIGKKSWQLADSLTSSILLYSLDKHEGLVRLLKFYAKYFDKPNLESAKHILSTAT
ncbi:hypothetical protein LSTR_LSTR003144 [Laodelphax striatellus]|uniref:Pentacotripeptide-repeat region of PRORP domain-containing protein n=1 Tax=Laodelphax striatellus TaxID=195883 RepID=A0A482WW54_LAOST|nr:hypothetical protein LSTR_LSTR003144 [Laodelphax striatellus]